MFVSVMTAITMWVCTCTGACVCAKKPNTKGACTYVCKTTNAHTASFIKQRGDVLHGTIEQPQHAIGEFVGEEHLGGGARAVENVSDSVLAQRVIVGRNLL